LNIFAATFWLIVVCPHTASAFSTVACPCRCAFVRLLIVVSIILNITPEKDLTCCRCHCRHFLRKEKVVTLATVANDVGSQQWQWWGQATSVENRGRGGGTKQSTNKRQQHGCRNGVRSGGSGNRGSGSCGSGSRGRGSHGSGNGSNGGNGGSGNGSSGNSGA
jgi:hypothetical protein